MRNHILFKIFGSAMICASEVYELFIGMNGVQWVHQCLAFLLGHIAQIEADISGQRVFNELISGHYNPSVRIIDLVSHTTYVVCVNIIHKWGDLQFKVDFERQIFCLRNFSWQFYLLTEFLPEICWEEIAEEILFVFRFDVWPATRTQSFRLISQHTIY